MDLPKGLQGEVNLKTYPSHIIQTEIILPGWPIPPDFLSLGVGPACSDKTLLSAIASALHTSPAPITGQLTAAVEKNPGVWLNTAQPLCKAFVVTDDDIRWDTFIFNTKELWFSNCNTEWYY